LSALDHKKTNLISKNIYSKKRREVQRLQQKLITTIIDFLNNISAGQSRLLQVYRVKWSDKELINKREGYPGDELSVARC